MAGKDRPSWLHVLERCDLQVLGATAPKDAPSVTTAIRAVAGFDVEPVAVIPAAIPQAVHELDRQWHHYAALGPLYDEKGEFLIIPPVSGGSEIGWVRVSDPVGDMLPSRIAMVSGSPEFIAVSVDGRHMCAASVEEYDYWVVTHEF
ncbi:hypothetical protein ABT167_24745 [Streptomyces sp. NPDC001792]|uniref:hypothetical protein n=1 Tax=Streptomyces sp. NPDC001792 TaxID=3154524 RepID=UPI0033264702